MGDAQLEEPAVTPVRAPRILDQPVALAVLVVSHCAVAHHGNCMVDNGILLTGALAVTFFQEAAFVAHEASRVRVHGNTDRSLGKQLFKSIIADIVLLQLAGVIVTGLVFHLLALLLRGLVLIRVVLFSEDAIGFGEGIGIEHPATTAAEVAFIAVN